MFRDNNQKRVQFIMDSMIETFEKREDVQSDQTLFSKMSKKALDMAIYASENLLNELGGVSNYDKLFSNLMDVYYSQSPSSEILDLIYWPTIQIFLWGFISKFFTLNSTYFENTVGIILSAAILYDFLFRSSISYNMMFLEEIWSRNFTNLFIAPIKLSEIITALTFTALIRTLIGIVPAIILMSPLFGVSILNMGPALLLLFLSLYMFGTTLGILVTSGLLRFGPAFENIAWSTMFLIAPFGCIYYPVEILPEWLQLIANLLPLVHLFEEMRSILINDIINYYAILKACIISFAYFSTRFFASGKR